MRCKSYLDTLRIHLVVFVDLRPVKPRIPLLVDEKVRVIYLLEFEFDRLDELRSDQIRCLTPHLHHSREVTGPEFDHNRICISVNNNCIMLLSVGDAVFRFDLLFKTIWN